MDSLDKGKSSFRAFVNDFGQKMVTEYWGTIWKIVDKNPEFKKRIPAFLLNPEKLIFYFGKTHWAIEYVGNVEKDELDERVQLLVEIKDYSDCENLMDEIVGFQLGNGLRFPALEYNQDLYMPTNEAFDILTENGWNFAAQSMMMGFGLSGFEFSVGQMHRFINCFFYGTDKHGLLVRHIKWLDVFPLEIKDIDEDTEQFILAQWPDFELQAVEDSFLEYPKPTDFQHEKLVILNRFVELFSKSDVKETDITKFLSEDQNQFILKMAFASKEIHSEVECNWINNPSRKPIRPDFFVTSPNGYSDILEFKLPQTKGKAVVGRENRESFSAEIYSYIAQTRVYSEYFEDSSNRNYVLEKHEIKVRYPRRWLVLGRRWMLDTEDWKALENDFSNIAIRTYDDILDVVISHLYS